jgi:hypothetical protein
MEQPKQRQRPQLSEIATRISQVYDQSFGKAKKSNLRIDRTVMVRITGRKRLEAGLLKKIGGKLGHKGLLLADIGGDFVVLAKDAFDDWRTPTDEALEAIPAAAPRKRAAADAAGKKAPAKAAKAAKAAKKPGMKKAKAA